jgi:NADH-quinone oxidoreductase subunit D
MFYVNFRLGGLSSELPIDFDDRTLALMDYLEEHVREYVYHLDSNPIFMERTKNIGVLTKKNAIEYGVTGPVARASGIDFDVRKELSYYMYKKIKFNTPVLSNGDCYDRYKIRFIEIQESINIIRACVQKMPKGSVKGAPIKLIGQPAKIDNIVIQHRELPRGEGIIYLVPEAQRPYRIALRSPSYINLSVLPHLSKGAKYADLFAILGSLDVVMAEIDK